MATTTDPNDINNLNGLAITAMRGNTTQLSSSRSYRKPFLSLFYSVLITKMCVAVGNIMNTSVPPPTFGRIDYFHLHAKEYIRSPISSTE